MLPHLLNQIPRDQKIDSVTADGAYDTRKCHNAIADRGAVAVVPPRWNAQPWKATTAVTVARNDALRASKVSGPGTLAKLEWLPQPKPRRNKPSRDHVTHDPAGQWMYCMKLLGLRLAARDFDRQVA